MNERANDYRRITVEPIAGALGAEIGGVDIRVGVDDETFEEIRRAWREHLVIFFHGQRLDDDSLMAFGRQFAPLFVHPNFVHEGSNPEIVRIRRRPGDARVVGEEWHSDTTMAAEPPAGSVLYAVDSPTYGGDTMFANQYLAYETLSDGLKATLDDLKAVHSDVRVAGPQAGMNKHRPVSVREDDGWKPTENVHPVVRTHPETGRRGLFVNRSYTLRFKGMTEEESKPLLDYLLDHAARPELTCRFRWRTGSVAVWDNRCTLHLAINDTWDFPRSMDRVQLVGDRPA